MSIIKIIKGDITKLQVDAIVNAANEYLLPGGGVDGAIHKAAGPELFEEIHKRYRPAGCPTGEARITNGYNLPADFVIHTVGPVWVGGHRGEEKLLASCYRECLKLAVKNGLKTIAFPAISTGAYMFPLDKANEIARETVEAFLEEDDTIEEVYFVCFDEDNFSLQSLPN